MFNGPLTSGVCQEADLTGIVGRFVQAEETSGRYTADKMKKKRRVRLARGLRDPILIGETLSGPVSHTDKSS